MRALATTLAFAGALLLPATAASADPIEGPPPLQQLVDELDDLNPADRFCVWYEESPGQPSYLACAPAPDQLHFPVDPT